MSTRNPPWSQDELIVTLDFYLRHSPAIPSKSSSEIAELSRFLNDLRASHGADIPEKFRNHNGVYMKLMNFRRLDPQYLGKGLERGGYADEVVWRMYADDREALRKAAAAILASVR